ncbi:hypothetical protein N206_06930 [Helicobacter pylori UM111]|nr:hypothetical protein N206_06930 [Helicobacter pylori UM111]
MAGFRFSCDLSIVFKKLMKTARYCLEFVNLGVLLRQGEYLGKINKAKL